LHDLNSKLPSTARVDVLKDAPGRDKRYRFTGILAGATGPAQGPADSLIRREGQTALFKIAEC
jgi:hypothetical protein